MKIKKISKKLTLTNAGNLELVFIGTGTPFTEKLFNNNFILIKGNTHIMVDFGFNAPTALKVNTGLHSSAISTLLTTHSHADHIGGIEYLALYNRYISQGKFNKPKLKLIITKEYQNLLWNHSIRGGMEWNETNEQKSRLTLDDYFEIINPYLINHVDRDIYEIDYEGIKLEIFKTIHIPDNAEDVKDAFPSYGLFVDDRILITCDTKFDPKLLELYKDKAEYIFHDCSFTPNPVHADLEHLRGLEDDLKKKMFLMHYSDDWENYNVDEFAGLAQEGSRYIF